MATSLAIRAGSFQARPAITMERVDGSEPTDGQLIERVADGDRAAFDELYRRYARAVLGLALRRLGDRGRAEDATQDAFVAIWRSARDVRPGPRNAARRGSTRSRATRSRTGYRRSARARRRARRRTGTRPRPSRRGRGLVDGVARASRARGPARARAARDRARVLERPLAERDRRAARDPARNREDANAERTRATRRRARGGAAMSERTPSFDELVGGDLEPAERERLLRVHELLVAAGPPPELSPRGARGASPAAASRRVARDRRRALRAVFARRRRRRRPLRRPRGRLRRGDERNRGSGRCHRVAHRLRDRRGGQLADGARRSQGLAPAASGRPYELWLTKDGELAALCGSFLTERRRLGGGAHERAVHAEGVRRLGRRRGGLGHATAHDLTSVGGGRRANALSSVRRARTPGLAPSTRTSCATSSRRARRSTTARAPARSASSATRCASTWPRGSRS